MSREELINIALSNINRSYSKYSKFKVSAAVEMDDGTVYKGVNVENASYGMTICAERAAIVNAISNGDSKKIIRIAIVSEESYPYPCGACRQFIREFTDDCEVIVAKNAEDYIIYDIKELLPEVFTLDEN